MVKRRIAEWPCWYHGPEGQSEIFQCLQDVPHGWIKTRPKLFEQVDPLVVDEEFVRAELAKLNVEIDPRWGKAHLQKVLNDRSTSR